MVGRGRPRAFRNVRQRTKRVVVKPFARYDQVVATQAQGSSPASTDMSILMVDNSGIMGGAYSVLRKVTFAWFTRNTADTGRVLAAVVKVKEGSSDLALDDESVVRDLQEQKQILRGPWMFGLRVSPGVADSNDVVRRTIVLQNVKVGPDDDLRLQLTLVDATTTTTNFRTFMKVWWRTVA